MINEKEMLTNNIGNNIAYYRKKMNLTQLELAEKLNYSDKSISKWERKEGVPDIYVLKELSVFFNISVDDLLNEHKIRPKVLRHNQVKAIMYSMILFLIASVLYFIFRVLDFKIKTAYLFIFAIPLFSLSMFIFNVIWKKIILIYIYMTIFVWTLALSLDLIFKDLKSYIVYISAIPFYIFLVVLIYYIFIIKRKGYKKWMKQK